MFLEWKSMKSCLILVLMLEKLCVWIVLLYIFYMIHFAWSGDIFTFTWLKLDDGLPNKNSCFKFSKMKSGWLKSDELAILAMTKMTRHNSFVKTRKSVFQPRKRVFQTRKRLKPRKHSENNCLVSNKDVFCLGTFSCIMRPIDSSYERLSRRKTLREWLIVWC